MAHSYSLGVVNLQRPPTPKALAAQALLTPPKRAGFFDLPKELRDVIYELMLHDKYPRRLRGTKFMLRARCAPRRNLICLCKLFKKEYLKCARKFASLEISNLNFAAPRCKKLGVLPCLAYGISTLVLNIVHDGQDNQERERDALSFMEWVKQVPRKLLKDCNVTVEVHAPAKYSKSFWGGFDLAIWIGELEPTKLELYEAEEQDVVNGQERLVRPETLVKRWTEASSRWEDVEQ